VADPPSGPAATRAGGGNPPAPGPTATAVRASVVALPDGTSARIGGAAERTLALSGTLGTARPDGTAVLRTASGDVTLRLPADGAASGAAGRTVSLTLTLAGGAPPPSAARPLPAVLHVPPPAGGVSPPRPPSATSAVAGGRPSAVQAPPVPAPPAPAAAAAPGARTGPTGPVPAYGPPAGPRAGAGAGAGVAPTGPNPAGPASAAAVAATVRRGAVPSGAGAPAQTAPTPTAPTPTAPTPTAAATQDGPQAAPSRPAPSSSVPARAAAPGAAGPGGGGPAASPAAAAGPPGPVPTSVGRLSVRPDTLATAGRPAQAGTTLAAPSASGPSAAPTAAPTGVAGAPGRPSPGLLPPLSTLSLAGPGSGEPGRPPLPATERTLAELIRLDPVLARQTIQTALPRPDAGLAGALLLFLSVARGGDARGWLGERALRTLEAAGRGETLARLSAEFAQQGRVVADPATGDWRSFALPLYDEGQLSALRLHVRARGEGEAAARPGRDGSGAHFLIDLDLSRLGPLQLDGTIRRTRFGLVLRSRRPLPADLRQDLAARFVQACAATGFDGAMTFDADPGRWIRVGDRRPTVDA